MDRAILYLYRTCNLAIEYSVILGKSSAMLDDQIVYISDTAFTDDLAIRYSTEGYLFKLFNRPID